MSAEFGFGQSLQTRREIHRVAKDGNASVGTVLHLPDHRRPGVETDAQLRPDAMFRFKVGSCLLEPLQDHERRPTRPKRRVLERNRSTEHCHNAVAGKASNEAALLTHCFVHQLRQTSHERIGRFLPRALREAREAHHVGEKDGDLSAFSLHADLRTLGNGG